MRSGTRRPLLLACLLGLLVVWTTTPAFAGPASPDPIRLKHPNGTTTLARMVGDEFQGRVETLDGYTVVQNRKTGAWEYAVLDSLSGHLVPSGVALHLQPEAPSFIERHLQAARNLDNEKAAHAILRRPALEVPGLSAERAASLQGQDPENAPITGTKKLLIILVNFQDRVLITTAAGWNATIFQTGAGAKSVRQFYLDNSFGALDIQPVPTTQPGGQQGIVTVSIALNHPNYGKNYDMATESGWLNQALAQAAASVDFAALDTNGNGVITSDEASIYFIPAGYENSGSAKTPNIWAHAWGGSLTAGTKTVNRWAMNGELNDKDHQHPMGVIAHELGHSLTSLPDLYNTNSATSSGNAGLGYFSLMAGGSWGRDAATSEDSGATPVAMDAWCRETLGWITPSVPTTNGQTVTLTPGSSATGVAAKLLNPSLSTAEYFLVENRQPTGWDRGLTRWFSASWAGGLLVLHIDNLVSSNAYSGSGHQKVMAVHANNAAYGTSGSAASLFYAGNVTDFTPASVPASSYYDGLSSTVGLTSASLPGATMTFNMLKVTDSTAPTGKPGTPVATTSLDTMTFTWTPGNAADPETGLSGYRLQVGTTPGGGDIFSAGVGNVLTKTVNDLGLKDGVPLYASVAALNGAGQAGTFSDSSTGLAIALPVFDGSALDNTSLTFKTIGPWTVDTATYSTGSSSGRSAVISDGASTYLQTRLAGPGTLAFDWRVVSEQDYDFLTLSIDGVDQAGKISGTTGFATKTASIPAGPHVVRWTYAKDANTAPTGDGAWVDHVSWTGPTQAMATVSPATYVTVPGTTIPFSATVLNGTTSNNVTWSVSGLGGTFSPATTTSGQASSFTAGATAGSFTITATPVQTPNTPGTAALQLVAPASVVVALTPATTTVSKGTSVTFTPSVSLLTDASVTWTSSGGAWTGTPGATATWSSSTPGTFTITATSTVAPSRSATATVTVLALSLNTTTATVLPGGSLTITATGDSGNGVDWTINPAVTKVDQGLSTTVTVPTGAPLLTTTYTLTATDKLDTTKKVTATLTVKGMDLVRDGALDPIDLLGFAAEWGKNTASPANFKGSGIVDASDLAALLNQIK